MISKKCKYAIKAVLNIANKYEKGLFSSSNEISQEENIPKKFLEGILLELRNAKILKSSRGKKGGYILLKPLNEITFTEIIRIIDGPIALFPCVSLNYYSKCEDCDSDDCRLKEIFAKVRDASLNILNETLNK